MAIHWMVKLVVSVAILGALGYDGISILTTSISTSSKADDLASDGADAVHNLKNVNAAYAVVEKEAKESGYTIRPQDFSVATNGGVTLVLRKTARSVWMTKISSLKGYLNVKETGTGAAPS